MSAPTLKQFQADEMLQVWVIHHLQIIGEAARGVSQTLRDSHPEVAWAPIVALRNILVHKYFGLNLQQVWTMTQRIFRRSKNRSGGFSGNLDLTATMSDVEVTDYL